jgi:type 1 fimbria pilin
MRHRILALAAVALAAAAIPARAQEHGATAGRQATITGTVVDVSCLVGSGATGDAHRNCAQACADGGLPLAIMSTDGTIYMALASAPGQGQNARLREHAEHRVSVTGTVIESHGVHGIKIESIAMAAAPAR